jgi:hypothetical protein
MKYCIIIFFLLPNLYSFSQEKKVDSPYVVWVPTYDTTFIQLDTIQENALRSQASSMVDALLKGDYPTYIKSVHPRVIKLYGGEAPLIAAMKKELNKVKIKSATIGEHTKVARAEGELHTFLEQELKMQLPNNILLSKSHLFAISKDNGRTWHFVDAASFTKENIYSYFPNYNPILEVPAKVKPVVKPRWW